MFLLSTVVTACLTLIPLTTRALEQAVMKPPITLQPAVASALVIDIPIRSVGTQGPEAALEREYARLGPQAKALYPHGVTQRLVEYGTTRVFPAPANRTQAVLLARDRICDHLRFTAGRCPTAAGEIAISAGDSAAYGWTVGSQHEFSDVPEQNSPLTAAPPRLWTMTVVGIWEQVPDDHYWLGVRMGGNAKIQRDAGVTLDEWVTSVETVAGSPVHAVRSYPAEARAATVDDLPRAATQLEQAVKEAAEGVRIEAKVGDLVAEGAASAGQIRVLVPLVMGQLALLVIAVLMAVIRSAVGERRQEIALARLRGAGPTEARRLLAAELLPPVLLGVPIGAALAIGITALLNRFVLPAGVPVEVAWSTLAAALLSAVCGIIAVRSATAPLSRATVTSLLQRGHRPRTGLGPLVWVSLTLAVAGIVVVRTSTEPTPLALAAPTLLALALGLFVAGVMPRWAARASRRALRRGACGRGLVWAAAARRASFRGAVVITAVAICAAAVAANAWAVGERNRTLRAELESGADTVLELTGQELTAVEKLVREADPSGKQATVVVRAAPNDNAATKSLILRPHELQAVAFPSAVAGIDFAPLAPPKTEPLLVSGRTLSVEVSADLKAVQPQDAILRHATEKKAEGELVVRAAFTTPTGRRVELRLGAVAEHTEAPALLSTPFLCEETCRLDSVTLDATGATGGWHRQGTVTVRHLAVDGQELPVKDLSGWQPGPGLEARQAPDGGLEISLQAEGSVREIRRTDAPMPLPALIAGPLPTGSSDSRMDAKGLLGRLVPVRRAGILDQVPALADRGILLDREVAGRTGVRPGPGDTLEVWFAPHQSDLIATVKRQLSASGSGVLAERRFTEIKARYDASGSAWGLSFALVVAALSLLVAAVFLIVSALLGWRAAASDLAVLGLAGVPTSLGRRTLAAEQAVVGAIAALTGTAAGLLGALLATPLVPLFTKAPSRPLPDLGLDPVLAPVLAGATLFLIAVGAVAAARVARRADPALVREEW